MYFRLINISVGFQSFLRVFPSRVALPIFLVQNFHQTLRTHWPGLRICASRPEALVLTVVVLHSVLPQQGSQGILKRKGQVRLSVHGVDEGVAQALRTPTRKCMGKCCAPRGFGQ